MLFIIATLKKHHLPKQDTDLFSSSSRELWGDPQANNKQTKRKHKHCDGCKQCCSPCQKAALARCSDEDALGNYLEKNLCGGMLAARNRIFSFSFDLSKMLLILRRSVCNTLLLMGNLGILHIPFKLQGFQAWSTITRQYWLS